MITSELLNSINNGGLDEQFKVLYGEENILNQRKRYTRAINEFTLLYGERDAEIFSVSGRSEISGNHTDHNNGCVLCASINLDIIAIASKSSGHFIKIKSEGFLPDTVDIDKIEKDDKKRFTSYSIISGVCDGFSKNGLEIGGFVAYTTSNVLKGSGLSSSASFEDMIGNILSHFYNNGSVSNTQIAVISKYAENEFFCKPCGLMDQVACAFGGFVYIDFKEENPEILPIKFDLNKKGYHLCIVNTGGSHASLNDDYAAIPAEMRKIASFYKKKSLREVDEAQFYADIKTLRLETNDRAILRAMHFFDENRRVTLQREALLNGDTKTFLDNVNLSGESSYKYLQNVYTTKAPLEQGLSLAIAITKKFLETSDGAVRVHGGGFAGTIQTFIKKEDTKRYKETMEAVFGKGYCTPLMIRAYGCYKFSL